MARNQFAWKMGFPERFMRTVKEEVLWLNEFGSLSEAKEGLRVWFKDYNRSYPHSSLDYRSPEDFERIFYERQSMSVARPVLEAA